MNINKKLQIGPIIKLIVGIAASVLLTVALYYGVINIGLSIVPKEMWHRELQSNLISMDSGELMDYAGLLNTDEKELSENGKKRMESYAERYDPKNTNLRYIITLDGKVLKSTVNAEENTLATHLSSNRIYMGTQEQQEQMEAYENWHYHGRYYDRETGTTYSRDHLEQMMREDAAGVEYENGINPTPSPMPGDVVDMGIADETIPMVTPNPTPHVNAAQAVEVTPPPTPTPRSAVEMPDIISSEEYHKLQDECYEELDVAMYVVDINDMTVDDMYHQVYLFVENIFINARDNGAKTLLCGSLGVLLVLLLIVTAGKRNAEGEHIAAGTGRLPWDVWLVLWCCLVGAVGVGVAFGVALPLNVLAEGISYYDNGMVQTLFNADSLELLVCAAIAGGFLCMALLVGTVHSVAARVKVPGWWRSCLTAKAVVWCWKWCLRILRRCRKVCKGIWHGITGLVKGVPMIWKAALVLGIVALVEIVYVCVNVWNGTALIAILWNLVKCVVCVWVVLMLKRLHDGAKIIADGNLDYRIDRKSMYGDLKTHAEYLNRIGDGLSRSVDSQLRSERMKTELITNVSHDLKTPLTSIVNYVDLLKKEQLTGTAGEYVEVLDRQSARLKKLTEDLVEASKASSGALTVNTERVNLQELAEQVKAEYGQRLEDAMLTPVIRMPEGKTEVWADGKYAWRILDNLLSNVCKYAMPGTRVYLEVTVQGDTATLSVKNMSRESLNISAEELTERFVRGDASRNTEGSGLGLSIAQSLAKLMGGEVRITIDGDLFKADVVLPVVK